MLRAPRLWDVIEEHLEDAAFLWGQWERALVSPVQRPDEIAIHLERRLHANLDGLRLACPEAVERLLLPALRSGERDRVVVGAAVLAELPDGMAHLGAALREVGASIAEPVARALGLAVRPALTDVLLATLPQRDPAVLPVALGALASRRADAGPPLLDLLRSSDPRVQAAALRAARASSQPVRAAVELACASPRPAVRDAAIGTGLRLGFGTAWTACERLIASAPPEPGLLYQALAASGDPAVLPWLERGLAIPTTAGEALAALGHAGWPGSVERILDAAEDLALARLAGEAFATITGVALEGPFVAEDPDAEAPALEEDELDADLAVGPERELELPDPDCLRSWWQAQASRFDPGVRHLGGEPWSPERLHRSFQESSMRRRRWLGLELAVRTRGRWEPELSGWASAQLAAAESSPALSAEAKLPFSRLLLG